MTRYLKMEMATRLLMLAMPRKVRTKPVAWHIPWPMSQPRLGSDWGWGTGLASLTWLRRRSREESHSRPPPALQTGGSSAASWSLSSAEDQQFTSWKYPDRLVYIGNSHEEPKYWRVEENREHAQDKEVEGAKTEHLKCVLVFILLLCLTLYPGRQVGLENPRDQNLRRCVVHPSWSCRLTAYFQ